MKKTIGIAVFLTIIILGAYHLLIFYDNNFRYGRMWETPAVRPHEEPILLMQAGSVPFYGGEEIYKAVPEKALESPLAKIRPFDIEKGKQAYFTYCAQCHGKNHDGNGTVGQSFYPLPTDLRNHKVQQSPEGRLFKEISYGIPGGRQPALAATIAASERWQIVAYIKSLGARKHP
ncbi:MAG: c-type cytochrome [Deltaproteobacteria bacterium]|nr:c-type cytochrome [Deltaproteobacteria bacterium]MBW1962992.1 c-type cytochrome [Deltaproteobacteria bacterium]MBW1993185.1 c-type cytochrome [Deltaproteobacteria bacterium]MBW2151813.1 c-type cytochrome [Deltaproteobacteria bacterium]